MLKLGEYYEDEAREVAKYLRNAGIKVDIRTFTDGRFDTFDFLEGRMSDLKGAIKDTKFEDYERYIAALRSLLSKGATSENFYEMFQTELVSRQLSSVG
jgi:methionine synthase II (cobalamin-independent)